jgi:hypothetical protein
MIFNGLRTAQALAQRPPPSHARVATEQEEGMDRLRAKGTPPGGEDDRKRVDRRGAWGAVEGMVVVTKPGRSRGLKKTSATTRRRRGRYWPANLLAVPSGLTMAQEGSLGVAGDLTDGAEQVVNNRVCVALPTTRMKERRSSVRGVMSREGSGGGVKGFHVHGLREGG